MKIEIKDFLPVRFLFGVIIFINLIFYLPVFKCYFAADDWYQIQNRSMATVISTFYGDWHLGTRGEGGFYRPLIRVLFYLEQNIFGLNAWGYHLTNLLFHIAAVLGLFSLLIKITKEKYLAFLCALIFSIFPTHTEPLFWISGRTDVVASAFIIWAIYFWESYLQYRNRDFTEANIKKTSLQFLLSAYLFFLFALMSKELALVYVFITPLFLLRRFSNERRQLINPLIHCISFIAIAILYLLFRKMILGGIGGYSFHDSIFNLPALRLTYKTFLLSIINPFSGMINFMRPAVFLLTLALIFMLFLRLLKFPFICVLGAFWMMISILPMSSLPATPISEGRYLYLPAAGYTIIISSLLFYIFIRGDIAVLLSETAFFNDKKRLLSELRIFLKNTGLFSIGLILAVYLAIGKSRHNDWVISGTIAKRTLSSIKEKINAVNDLKKNNSGKIVLLTPREKVGGAHLFQGWSLMQAVWVYMNDLTLPIHVGLRQDDATGEIYLKMMRDGNVIKMALRQKENFKWDFDNLSEWDVENGVREFSEDSLDVYVMDGELSCIISNPVKIAEKGSALLSVDLRVKSGGGYLGEAYLIYPKYGWEKFIGNIYNDVYDEFSARDIQVDSAVDEFRIKIIPSMPSSDYSIKKIEFQNFIFDKAE